MCITLYLWIGEQGEIFFQGYCMYLLTSTVIKYQIFPQLHLLFPRFTHRLQTEGYMLAQLAIVLSSGIERVHKNKFKWSFEHKETAILITKKASNKCSKASMDPKENAEICQKHCHLVKYYFCENISNLHSVPI